MLLSFVLEMDNADALGDIRGLLDSFDSVLRSCAAVGTGEDAPTMELAIVTGQSPHVLVEELLLPRAVAAALFQRVIVVFAPDTTYYEKKMLGAMHARGDVVSFIDSDVTYSESWLGMMIHEFRDEDCDVAYGCTYARLGSPAENAAALVWQFAIDDPRDPRRSNTGMIWSNNWMVRRAYLLANPLPRVSGDLKLEGSLWDAQVRGRGARVRHVPTLAFHTQPASVLELFALGLRSGRSNVVGARRRGASPGSVLFSWLRHNGMRTTAVRMRRLRQTVAFTPTRVACLQLTWFLGMGVGIVVELMHPVRQPSYDYSLLQSAVTVA